jgi:alanyl-tRNA synthetase
MKSSEIRDKFLKYFEANGHKIMPSSSLVPADPTVLLTLAGMLQFKPIFLGVEKPKQKRVTTVQKCIRTNDIENVGRTARHHTFFEMLGNFSFGDYFKKEAIAFAWELLTIGFGLPAEKMMIAVYEKDDEAYNIWNKIMGIPTNRIFKLGDDNNFWAAGPTGPCGPCSEIYFDLGPARGCGKPDCGPGCDCDRFLEIWNLVFIQYNRVDSNTLVELPSKNIDTGMGLERITSILQGVTSNFGTDLFKPILDAIDDYIKVNSDKYLVSRRIIADHIRAITHLIADQVMPTNEGRGYILRRLIRRAIRHAKLIGINEPFLYKLSGVVADVNGEFYPEVKKESNYISQVIRTEEEHFRKTLEQGLDILNKIIKGGATTVSGKDVFLLHDTYGFPMELTREIALESGIKMDEQGFVGLMEQQKDQGRTSGITAVSKQFAQKIVGHQNTKFLGYASLSTDARIIHIEEKDKLVVLDKTVFYPEGGGQLGDVGSLSAHGKCLEVVGTYGQTSGVIAHQVKDIDGLKEKDTVKAVVDANKRKATSIHHTSTHLLHATLRELFGKGVKQAGSYVYPDGFRFDFSHFGSISKDDLERIERRVNELIKEKLKVEIEELPLEEANKRGALMFFGEKYGETVRMIKIGDFSLELCGGTHIKNTSEASFFKIVSESSISAGVRRIEAKAGEAARKYVIDLATTEWEKNKQMFGKYETLELKKEFLEGKPETYYQFFRVTTDEIDAIKKYISQGNILLINKLLDDFKKKNEGLAGRMDQLHREIEAENLAFVSDNLEPYIKNAVDLNGIKVVRAEFKHYSSELLRRISDLIKSKCSNCVSVLFSVHHIDKVTLLVSLSDELVQKGLDAGALVKLASPFLGGGGGGKKTIAEAGGKDTTRLNEAFDAIVAAVKAKA